MIDAVVYDFGGVFMVSPFEAIRRMAADRGDDYEVLVELLFGAYDDDNDHPWHRAERGEVDVATARDEITRRALDQGVEIDLFDLFRYIGADREIDDAMVDSVRRARAVGCKTAILTNNIIEAREYWKTMIPVEELFDVVVDSSEVGMRKPDPRVYRHAVDLLGVAPARAVFLDDVDSNVRAAESIGMFGIVVDVDRSGAIAALDDLLARRAEGQLAR